MTSIHIEKNLQQQDEAITLSYNKNELNVCNNYGFVELNDVCTDLVDGRAVSEAGILQVVNIVAITGEPLNEIINNIPLFSGDDPMATQFDSLLIGTLPNTNINIIQMQSSNGPIGDLYDHKYHLYDHKIP